MRTITAFGVSLLLAACGACNGKTAATPSGQGATSAASQANTSAKPGQAPPAPSAGEGGRRIEGAFPAQVAGKFYPEAPGELRAMVRGFIDNARTDAFSALVDRDVVGVLAPHAGYPYSGPVAGAAYRALEGRGYKTVVVLALSHRRGSDRIAALDRPAYDTPLGAVPIDRTSVARLTQDFPREFAADEAMFASEHSLEVQLPFIQVALPDAAIVPLVVGVDDDALLERAGDDLFKVFGQRRDVAFVVSSDLSHYHPPVEANAFDEETLGALERFELPKWRQLAVRQSEGMCGFRPMEAFVGAFGSYDAKKRSIVRLDHRNSGDTAGDKASVVGYGALAFTVEKGMRDEQKKVGDFGPYGAGERRALMELAKRAVDAAANGRELVPEVPSQAVLAEKGAAFVTLKEGGELRGCIGHVIARMPLYQCIAEVARAAAIYDSRFTPVRPEELPKLEYEISVLTAPRPTTPDQVVVGRDGLIMSRGGYSGLLLPQVPVEWGWQKEEFLAHTCRKAGLPLDCWKDPATKIESFQAIVWGEGDLGE
jgi:MEMO1 family protein